MGKYKSRRYKLHKAAPSPKTEEKVKQPENDASKIVFPDLSENVFEGIDILGMLDNRPKNQDLENDDTVSVKSYKSIKSMKGESVIPKKEKRKLKRQLLLRKIDTVNQLKKELKQPKKDKKPNNDTIGDIKSFLESLPEYNMTESHNSGMSASQNPRKKRGIEKSRNIQKKTVKQVNFYKKLLKNKDLKEDPFAVITQHVQKMVENEKKNEPKPVKIEFEPKKGKLANPGSKKGKLANQGPKKGKGAKSSLKKSK